AGMTEHDALSIYRSEPPTLLTRQPYAEADIGRDLNGSSLFRQIARSDRGAFRDTADSDREPRLSAYRKVEGLPLVLGIEQPESLVLAEWRQK
ncbi:hypothetical protein ABTN43_19085, partial [Acinetobacter baumannii]